MEEHNRVMIKNIKSKVRAMLDERHQLLQAENATGIAPSKYWVDCCSYFDYMLGLSEEAYSKIRLHTHHLTADYYQTYYFGDPEAFRVANKLD
jgi:hypothetical protein